ncbi:MAG TPA: hypothetical protein PLL06_07330 [Acidobacteriota bacterium]|nr:hypothetical protein [Acidobacteriota bacterium]HNB71455.1 hypothetical protein [Acidobacteriota bacterium]HNG96500.1 hypothetical protein [Acidobacteriota bacterium]HNJ41492.1 hypothetical protein [Acidobacteriota bacterium]
MRNPVESLLRLPGVIDVAQLLVLRVTSQIFPARAYRLTRQPQTTDPDLKNAEGYIQGFRLTETWALQPSVAQSLWKTIFQLKLYGNRSAFGMRCFRPGTAIEFGQGAGSIQVVICLGCHWVYFHRGNWRLALALTPRGVTELRDALSNRLLRRVEMKAAEFSQVKA